MTKILAFDRDRRNVPPSDANSSKVRRDSGSSPIPLRRPDHEQVHDAPVQIAASVVVPTRGRPQLLNRCLASLVLQRFDPARFEIIVVDDGPSADTRDVVAGWAAHTEGHGPQIIYIPSMGPHGPAAARNHGWRAARAPIIAFTDDDTIARTDWLRSGVRAFEDGVDAVCGRVVMPLSHTPTDYELDAKNLETAEFVTANCFCRRQVLDDLGGFDERFRFAWREDSDLHFRLLEYRANIVQEPRAVMMHPIRPAGWGVSLSQVKKIQFDALLYKKHPKLYRERIAAAPPWDYYLAVAALLVALGALLVGNDVLALVAGLGWLALTVRLCRQRLRGMTRTAAHVADVVVTSALIPPLAVFWRLLGAVRYRVRFT